MKEHTQTSHSHFIWQPLLLLTVSGYLLAEIYFLTAMVNTFDAGIRASDFSALEFIGRLISGAGIGLSVLIGLSLNQKLNQTPGVKRIAVKVVIFAICTTLGYVAVKSLYQLMENHASKPIVHCSVLGNAAIRVFDRGQLPGFEAWGRASSSVGYKDRQLIRLYLPLHVCISDDYRRVLQASDVVRSELTEMVMDTGLAQKVASPALDIYQGFRAQIARFSNEIANIEALEAASEARFQLRKQSITRLGTLLKSQSRYTATDVQHILSVYACALDTAVASDGVHSTKYLAPQEQRFMLALTGCLFDRARGRFKTIPEVQQATDIYLMEHAIAADWASQFILSPNYLPENALALLRQSFALVFLPTYAVFISTFVVFVCLASYFRTRFLIRAMKTKQRVNPVINAVLSPLVVVPGVWTLLFLWVSEPRQERILFPGYTQSAWVQVVKVTLRPLFYYYQYSYPVLEQLHFPLFLASRETQARHEMTNESNAKKIEPYRHFKTVQGYYAAELCTDECQRVLLDLHPQGEPHGILRYASSQCESKLIYDSTTATGLRYFEVTQEDRQCDVASQWVISHVKDKKLSVTVLQGDVRIEAELQPLNI